MQHPDNTPSSTPNEEAASNTPSPSSCDTEKTPCHDALAAADHGLQLTLLDGRVIEAYAVPQPSAPVDNEMSLDTTGQYFSVRKKPRIEPTPEELKAQQERESHLFTDNAFLFLSHAQRILSDSRMFLAPVKGIISGLAYTGTGGFRHPTLGVYVEWWLSCLAALQQEAPTYYRHAELKPQRETGQWLLFRLAGSPLSGSNACDMVSRGGEQWCGSISDFSGAWRTFVKINSRYDEAKSVCQAYTLQEVLEILAQEGCTVNRLVIDNLFLANKVAKIQRDLEYYERRCQEITDEFHQHLVLSRADEIEQALSDLEEEQAKLLNGIDDIKRQRRRLRRQLKDREITNVEYQRAWHPLHLKLNDTQNAISHLCDQTRRRFFDGRVTLSEMQRFLKLRHQQ